MSASSYNLCIQKNVDYSITLQLKNSSGVPIDLTDAFVYSEIRQDYYLPVIQPLTAAVINAVNGTVRLSLTAEQTLNLHPGTLKYDVLVRYVDNTIQKVLRGDVEIENNITTLGYL